LSQAGAQPQQCSSNKRQNELENSAAGHKKSPATELPELLQGSA